MEEGKYAECHKAHQELGGKTDGCQEFMAKDYVGLMCCVCDWDRNFHRKVGPTVKYETEVVYTKCHKIHDFKSKVSVDGCQEFTPAGKNGLSALTCAVCGCHRCFHRNEITVEVKGPFGIAYKLFKTTAYTLFKSL